MCAWVQEHLINNCNITKGKISFDSGTYQMFIVRNKINVLKYMYYPCVNKEIVLDRKYKTAKILILNEMKKEKNKTV